MVMLPSPTVTRNAAVYARISSDPNGTALGVGRQIDDCQALAARLGWHVRQVFTDNDCSATSRKPRPQYHKMMAALRAGHLDALVVWDVDRLTRSPRELEDIVDLAEQHGVELASVGGEIDLATPQGRLTARIKGSVGKHEAEQISTRACRKAAERAAAGAPSGRPSYGWRREQVYDDQGRRLGCRDVIHPEQARVIRESAAAVLAGESLRSVVGGINARGEAPLHTDSWSTSALRGILLRERNVGLRVHRGQVVGPATWEPILDDSTFARVTAVLTDPSRRNSPPGAAPRYLLSGLARCSVCDGPLRGLLAGRDHRTTDSYICQEGAHLRISRPPVDAVITELVIARLAAPETAAAFARADSTETQEARKQADDARARLDLAADSYAAGEIDARQLARITARLRPEAERWEQLARAAATDPDLDDLATPDIARRWAQVPLGRQRAVIARLLEITVLPVPSRWHTEPRTGLDGRACAASAEHPCGCQRFDPARVVVRWRSEAEHASST